MATQIGQLKYSVGFDVKKQDLNALKTQLQQLKKLSLSDLMKINQSDRTAATESFKQIREQAEYVEKAIKDAFNVKLNTVNIETFNKSLKDSHTSLQQVYNTFKQGGVAGQNAFRSLVTQVTTANTQLKQTHKFLDNIATTLGNTIKWNIASSAVNTLSNSIQQAWGYVKSLDTSLNDIMIVTGKSADQMSKFSEQANKAAASLGKTTVDYTKAALIYAQQGLSDEDIATRAAITLKTANVTGQSTDAVSEQLTSVWNGYKVSAEQAELYIDRLAAVAATTASNLEQLSTGMSKVAAAAAAMGVGQDQLAAQLSTIISVTRQAPESVGTALRTVYARISDIQAGLDEDGVTLGNYSGKMAELGFKVLDVNDNLRDMGQVIEEIGGRWSTLSREQQVSLAQTMAGQRQYSNLIALFDNFDKYTEALHTAQNAAGTLQQQQDIYMESTRAHLNQLKAATQDLYDSLVNADSIEPLIDGLTKVVSLGAKFVDSIGGGGAVLTSLGAIGVSVFSTQIAQGINTTITNLEIAKRNAQQFDNILQTIQEWKGIAGLDQSTKTLLQNKEQLLNLSGLMTPEQFSGMQTLLNNITQTGNKLAAIKDQKGIFENQLKEISGIKEEWKDFNNVLKDAEAQQAIEKNLETQETNFTNAANQLKEYGNSIRQVLGSQGTAATDINTLKNNIGQYLKNLEQLSATDGAFKNHAEQISNLRKEFDNLNNIPESELPAKLSQIAASMQGLFTSGANAAQGLREKLVEEFAETARSLGYSEKQIEDLLNKLVKSFENSQKQIERTAKLKGITDLIGSFSRLGASINQIKNIGKIINDKDLTDIQKWGQSITNVTTSLTMMVPAAISAGKAIHALNTAISAATWGWIALGATAVLAIGSAVIEGIQAQNEALIELNKTQIEEQNKIQEQIQNNKKLYSSIEDLNEQYEQGKITRSELKSQVENLIDQYDLESTAANKLRQDYDNLTEAIRAAREQAAREGKGSAERAKGHAQQLVLDTAKGGIFDAGMQKGNQYQLALSPGSTFLFDEPDYIQNLFKTSGAEYGIDGFTYNVDFNTASIVELYDTVDHIAEVIQKTDQLTDAQKNQSELYQNAVKWLQQMRDSIEKYRQALNDVAKYATQLTAITSKVVDLENIQNANQYIEERIRLIEQIQKMLDLQGNTDADATAMADAYLNENYRELYNQYNQALQYITTLRQKFRSSNTGIESLIASLDQDSLAYLKKFYDLDNISNWKQLESIVKFLIDPNNADRLIELSSAVTGEGTFESAQSKYDLYSSLSDQIASSKKQTISKKEFEKLDPQIQKFFTLMANGQFKMTGDAKEFYETVNNLSLSGFKDNINSILQEEERLKTILGTGESDYFKNIKESLNHPESLTADSQVYDLLSQAGYDVIPWLSNPDWEAINQMKEALESLEKQGLNLISRLQELDTELYSNQYAIFSSANSIKELRNLYEDAIESLNDFGATTEQNQIVIQAYNQALIDLNNELDLKTLNTDQLSQYASYLQEIAQTTEDLSNDLIENADAAEIVAKSIMKMNDGFDELGKNWDAWLDVLQKSTESSEQFATAMQGAQAALAQLLDISQEYITNDFVKQHLDLITEASNGSAQAINGLKQALVTTFVQGIINEKSLQGLADEIWTLLANIQAEIPNFEVGMQLNDGKFLAKMQNLVNVLELDADQINALFDSLGFEPTFVTESMPITQEVPASQDVYKEIGRAEYDGINSVGKQFTASFPIVRHYSEDTTQTIDGFVDVPALSTNGVTPRIKTITKKATPHFSNYSVRNAGGAATPKKQTKTKTTEAKPDTSTKQFTKSQKDDRDIYHDINIEIQDISRELTRIQKQGNKLAGTDLIKNLNKQLQILTKQKVKLQQKNELQKLDLQKQKQQLSLLGVTFDEYGHINNYLDVMGGKISTVNGYIEAENAIITQYNATTDKEAKTAINDRLTQVQRQRKNAEDAKKDLQSAIKDYDKLVNDIENLADQITDIAQQRIQIQITKFKMKVELTLDIRSLQQAYNEFLRNVINADDLFRTSSGDKLYKNAQKDLADYQSYYDVNNVNSIATLTQQIAKAKKAYEETGNSEYLDQMKSYVQKLEDSMENMKKLEQDIQQIYFDTIEDIDSQADRQMEQYEYLEEQLQHDIDLVTLIYGQHQYDAMETYYNQLRVNHQNELNFLRSYADQLWQSREEAILRGQTEVAEEYLKLWEKTNKQLNEELKASIEDAKNQYLNTIDKIYYELELKLSNNKGFDYLSMEWELINKNADQYLDTINAIYAVQDLERKFAKAINDNTTVKAQKELTNLMNQQLDYLKSKDKLTQYDVDRAEKLLEIEKARLALEDTRNSKTSLRLKRDSQGNYSYVYSANQDDIFTAQEQLAKLQNELYNFDKQAYQDNLDDTLAATKEYLEKRKALQIQYNYADEEQKQRLAEQLKLLDDNYYEYLEGKATENSVIRKNLQNSVAQQCESLYISNHELFEAMADGNYISFEEMSDDIKDKLINDLVPGYQGGIQDMIDTFYGIGDGDLTSFRGACLEAWDQVENATNNYEQTVSSLAEIAGADLNEIKNGVDSVANAYNQLIPKNETILNGFISQQQEIDKLLKSLDSLKNKNKDVWDAAVREIDEATEALKDYISKALEALDIPSPSDNNYNGVPSLPTNITPAPVAVSTAPTSSPSTTQQNVGGQTANKAAQIEQAIEGISMGMIEGIYGAIRYGLWGSTKGSGVLESKFTDLFGQSLGLQVYNRIQKKLSGAPTQLGPKSDYLEYSWDELKKRIKIQALPEQSNYAKKMRDPNNFSLDTGGYTGEWGTEGRWAVLHQKQLVLNADDTRNMLDAISILRNVVSNINGQISSRLGSLGNKTIYNRSDNGTLDQNVNIQANFPNVNSKKEIEEAFSELVNLAAQRAMKRSKA